LLSLFFFQAEDGIRDFHVTGVQTCALPIFAPALTAQGLQTDYLDQPERVLELLQQEDFELLLIHDTLAQMRGSELLQIVRLSWRSEERRVGKECRSRGWPCHQEENRCDAMP